MKRFKLFLNEGGAFGHLQNVWDVNFSKGQLIQIILKSLDLKFDRAQIKTDAVNLMFSVKNGVIIASRNKGHLKNYGENAMSAAEVSAKFAGRDVGVAYDRAMADLQKAISALSVKQQEKIFGNGRKWMSIEVMGHGGANIIDYKGIKELRLHGTLEVDGEGNFVSQVNKEDARTLEGMLKQRGAEKQSNFTIKDLTPAQFKSIANVNKHKANLVSKLKNALGSYKNIEEYKKGHLTNEIRKHTKDVTLISLLINRWLYDDKSTKITDVYKQYPNDKTWIQSMIKTLRLQSKTLCYPLNTYS